MISVSLCLLYSSVERTTKIACWYAFSEHSDFIIWMFSSSVQYKLKVTPSKDDLNSFICTWTVSRFIVKHVFIAVCTYRLVMISIERSKTAQKSALEILDKFSPRQNAVWDKIQPESFFFRWPEHFFLSRTEFCLRLICLGLHTTVVFRMQSFNLLGNEHMERYQWLW